MHSSMQSAAFKAGSAAAAVFVGVFVVHVGAGTSLVQAAVGGSRASQLLIVLDPGRP